MIIFLFVRGFDFWKERDKKKQKCECDVCCGNGICIQTNVCVCDCIF